MLTEKEVREIRAIHATVIAGLADRFGTSKATIRRIVRRGHDPADEVPLFQSSDAAAGYLAKLTVEHSDLDVTGADLIDSPAQLRRAWLVVAKVVHPDTPMGSTGAFQRAEAAKRMVEAEHKERGVA